MAEQSRIPAFCTQCRSRCGCEAVVEHGRLVRIDPLPGHPTGEKLCPKGRAAPELVYHPDRLTTPLRRTSPKGAAPAWLPISWDEALDEIAGHMARIRDAHGPEQVAFSVTTPSGTHISDSISWIERFIRAFGSPNTIYGTEICNWHKDFASRLTYGWDIGTPDFARSGCILLWGNNPAATWLARSVEIQKALKRGAKLVVVDPRPTLYARRADVWLRVRPGTDQALALGLANLLIRSGRFDGDFVRRWTNGPLLVSRETGRFLTAGDVGWPDLPRGAAPESVLIAYAGGELIAYDSAAGEWIGDPDAVDLQAESVVRLADGRAADCRTALRVFAEVAGEWPVERVAEVCGVPGAALESAADMIADCGPLAYYAWNGIGQGIAATQTDRAISILYAMTGHYGSEGGNVPGSAAVFNDISGQNLLTPEQREKALGLSERPLGPGRHGWVTARDVYRAVTTGRPYPVRMLVSFGGNLLAAQPDTDLARRALAELDFHVHADFFLNSTAELADIVLPVATSWERDGLRTGFDASLEGLRRVQYRRAAIAPAGEARGDTDIIFGLASRLGLDRLMFDCNADEGHAHVLAAAGIGLDELKNAPGPLVVEGSVPINPYLAGGFPTPSRRIEIYSERLLEHGQAPIPGLALDEPGPEDGGFPLRLGCAKTVAYCHSQGRNIPSLRRLAPDPVLEMAPATAADRGIGDGDWVVIATKAGRFIARAKLVEALGPGSVFAQHGWTAADLDALPGAAGERMPANMNRAVPTDRSDPVSGSVALRCSWCEVRRIEAAAAAAP